MKLIRNLAIGALAAAAAAFSGYAMAQTELAVVSWDGGLYRKPAEGLP